MNKECTLAVIKPDAIHAKQTGNIINCLEQNFKIIGMKMVKLSVLDARTFYAEHQGKDFFDDLVEFISSGPVLALILEGEDAVKVYRKLMVDVLRPIFGTSTRNNAVHGSDSLEAAKREIDFFWSYHFS